MQSRTNSLAVIAAAVSGILFAAPALAAEWKIDPHHSSANFSIRHMMISNVTGNFQKVSGTVEYDGKNLSTAKVKATIDAASISTGNADRDKHVKAADFLNVEKYPEMKFESKKVIKGKKGAFKLVGDLTLHGTTKEVTLDVEGPSETITDPRGNTKFGASATTKINRKDFGINYSSLMDNGGAMVGEEVKVTIDVEISQEKKADAKGTDGKDAGKASKEKTKSTK